MSPYWQNGSCDPFTPISSPCTLGNYVSYSINVSGANDVKEGVRFAKQNNVRLVIKNTGHECVRLFQCAPDLRSSVLTNTRSLQQLSGPVDRKRCIGIVDATPELDGYNFFLC
jgi:hypothetical protein